MHNLSSYCVLIDAQIRASDKDLPLTSIPYARHYMQWLVYFFTPFFTAADIVERLVLENLCTKGLKLAVSNRKPFQIKSGF